MIIRIAVLFAGCAFVIRSHNAWYYLLTRNENTQVPFLIQGIQENILSGKDQTCSKADCLLLPHQQTQADLFRISNVQYIGKTLGNTGTQGVAEWLEMISFFSPFREYPYVFGQIVIPLAPESKYSTGDKETSWEKAQKLGEDGIQALCNTEKIEAISTLRVEQIVAQKASNTTIMNPCVSSKLPLALGFNAFFYLKEYEKSLKYYKIALAHNDVPPRIQAIAQGLETQVSPMLTQILIEYEYYISLYTLPRPNESDLQTSLQKMRELLIKHFQIITAEQCISKSQTCIQNVYVTFKNSCQNSVESKPLDQFPRFTTKGILCSIAVTPPLLF